MSQSVFEKLYLIASGTTEPLKMAALMIGHEELALLLANAAVKDTSLRLRPCNISAVTGLSRSGAQKKSENTVVRLNGMEAA
jgi:hypothetical protein